VLKCPQHAIFQLLWDTAWTANASNQPVVIVNDDKLDDGQQYYVNDECKCRSKGELTSSFPPMKGTAVKEGLALVMYLSAAVQTE
jgi:hypothetical protein